MGVGQNCEQPSAPHASCCGGRQRGACREAGVVMFGQEQRKVPRGEVGGGGGWRGGGVHMHGRRGDPLTHTDTCQHLPCLIVCATTSS